MTKIRLIKSNGELNDKQKNIVETVKEVVSIIIERCTTEEKTNVIVADSICSSIIGTVFAYIDEQDKDLSREYLLMLEAGIDYARNNISDELSRIN